MLCIVLRGGGGEREKEKEVERERGREGREREGERGRRERNSKFMSPQLFSCLQLDHAVISNPQSQTLIYTAPAFLNPTWFASLTMPWLRLCVLSGWLHRLDGLLLPLDAADCRGAESDWPGLLWLHSQVPPALPQHCHGHEQAHHWERYGKTCLQRTLWWRDTCYRGILLLGTDWFSTVNTLWSGTSANHEIPPPLPGVRGQFVSCGYSLSIDFYSHNTDFIDLVWKPPCGSAWMVQVEPEAMGDLFFNTRECWQINNVDLWICWSFSTFI